MNYALLVMGAATAPSSATALSFARELLARGHRLHCVFFFGDGVHNASSLLTPPQDETPICQQWQDLQQCSSTELLVCISSALRRGVVDEAEARRYELAAHNLHSAFSIAGLGQWVEACVSVDRILRFGGQ